MDYNAGCKHENWRALSCLCSLLGLAAIGCGSSEFQLAQVTGVVTIDDKPYPGGKVIFAPVAKNDSLIAGRTSFGILDDQGQFILSCYKQGDGAIVGQHTVTLFRAEDDNSSRPDLKRYKFSRVSLPNGPIEVTPGENRVTIALTSDEIRKYGNRL